MQKFYYLKLGIIVAIAVLLNTPCWADYSPEQGGPVISSISAVNGAQGSKQKFMVTGRQLGDESGSVEFQFPDGTVDTNISKKNYIRIGNNTKVSMVLKIDAQAPLGERVVVVRTKTGVSKSRDFKFSVVRRDENPIHAMEALAETLATAGYILGTIRASDNLPVKLTKAAEQFKKLGGTLSKLNLEPTGKNASRLAYDINASLHELSRVLSGKDAKKIGNGLAQLKDLLNELLLLGEFERRQMQQTIDAPSVRLPMSKFVMNLERAVVEIDLAIHDHLPRGEFNAHHFFRGLGGSWGSSGLSLQAAWGDAGIWPWNDTCECGSQRETTAPDGTVKFELCSSSCWICCTCNWRNALTPP